MKKIIFICTGNICRSPMAQYYMKERLKKLGLEDEYFIDSCGTFGTKGERATLNTMIAMEKYDVCLNDHRAKNIKDVNLEDYDYIMCLTLQHKQQILQVFPDLKEKVFTLKGYNKEKPLDLDIKDPWGYDRDVHAMCAKEIVYSVDELLENL